MNNNGWGTLNDKNYDKTIRKDDREKFKNFEL